MNNVLELLIAGGRQDDTKYTEYTAQFTLGVVKVGSASFESRQKLLITPVFCKKATFQFQYQEKEICFLEVCWTSPEHVKDNR